MPNGCEREMLAMAPNLESVPALWVGVPLWPPRESKSFPEIYLSNFAENKLEIIVNNLFCSLFSFSVLHLFSLGTVSLSLFLFILFGTSVSSMAVFHGVSRGVQILKY
jgi:hypothetical protein